ncbi:uncharacterized protein LOC143208326 isoform X2 [Lasioglossum baleicum]|uniref:uncharacterized protein LOC143208326 isoform X2 n=1 Tax=Lasioglossum baleicum TaxID=434251 RepID=UPI003FCE2C00
MDLNFPDFLMNEPVQNDNLNPADLTQNYLLLKKKICETHEVIKQYNDKLKECERVKSDLDSVTKQAKKVTCSYNATLAKVIKLEIQNTEYKKNINTLTTQVNDHKVKAAADQQYIQQLICKIKDVENQSIDKIMQYDLKNSSSEMKIKELEAELKTIKKTYETKIKKMEKKSPVENNDCHSSKDIITKNVATNTCSNSNNTITKNVATNTCNNSNNVITKNVATNTCGNSNNVITKNTSTNTTSNQTRNVGTITDKDDITKQSQVSDKCVLTDEFYRVSDMYPIFCAKCEVHIEPTPVDKICNVMTESCPKLLEKISSPLEKPAPVRSDVTNGYRKAENLIALPETPPPHFHTEFARSAFTSPNLPAPMPLNHMDYCHNFSQPPNLLNQNASCIRSTPIRASLANTTTASQTDHCEGKTLDTSSQLSIPLLENRMDKLAKKLRKKMKKLKSQKSSSCCQHSHPTPPHMFDMNSTMQLNFMELCRRMTDMYQFKEKEPVAVYKPRDKTRKKSRLSRPKPTKKLRSPYGDNSWEVEPVSKKAKKSSATKRPKKRKHSHPMLLKKSDVSIENSEHTEQLANDSDSNSYDNLFDTTLTNEDVSNKQNDSSCEETMNETCNDVIKPLTHSSGHSTDVDEPETVDRVKNCSKSMRGETDSGIHSDSVESSKLVQYEPDLDSCFISKTRRNARNKVAVKSASSFAGNFKSNRSRSTEKSPTNEDDKPNSVLPSFLREEPETSEEPEISESTSKNVTVMRKRKIGELEEPKHRLELMRKLRNLRKKPVKNQTFPKLNITEEAAYCESQKEDEKKQLEQEAETIEKDYVPKKKKSRIAHTPKVAKKENISLNSCAQTRTSLVKNLEDKNVKPQITIVNRTEADPSIVDETNMTQETPVQTIAKEDNEKLADKSSSETVEDASPLSPDPDPPNEMSGEEKSKQSKVIPVEPVVDISALIAQSAESRKGLEINLPARKKSLTETGNGTNEISALIEQSAQSKKGVEINLPARNKSLTETGNGTSYISALEESEQREKGLEINLPTRNGPVIETDNAINDISTLIISTDDIFTSSLQSEQTRKGLEINFPVRRKPVIDSDKMKNESNDELRTNGSDQLEEWTKSLSCHENDSLLIVEEVVENNKPFDSNDPWVLRKYRAKEMNYYRDIKLNSHTPVEILERLNNENTFKSLHSKKEFNNLEAVRATTDKFVTEQLQRLVDSEWKSDVHQDVLEKLKTTCTPRIIAKNIVDFLSNEGENQQSLDKTHTPPAPLMTKSQQRITALLVDLEKEFPMIIELVQSGIEFKIFRFNQKLCRYIVVSLARMYTVLARVQKDRERYSLLGQRYCHLTIALQNICQNVSRILSCR